MAYAIEKGEPISEALPRIVMERIDAAYTQLHDRARTPEERVHGARKRFKEARAAIRLIRGPLESHFAVENAWFRDAGRDLAALRDADAVLEAIGTLEPEGFHERRVHRRARRRLVRLRDRARIADLDSRIENAAAQLPLAKARVTLWPRLSDDFASIGGGLRRTYRDGRRAFQLAAKKPSPEAFHEWRKRVKDHWYHTQILRHVWPEVMKPYRDQMEELSDALGDRHDLDVAQELVLDQASPFGNDFEIRVLRDMVQLRAANLSRNAIRIGALIYAEPSRAVARRFESYWDAWLDDSREVTERHDPSGATPSSSLSVS
jgi:CHAD domain-containing protein